MTRERALELQHLGLRAWIGMLGRGSEGATVLELDGVTAAVIPITPERSICNSVVYEDVGRLEAALDTLAATYAGAGIAAWTVWTPEFDAEAIELLEGAGHRFDGKTRAMSLELDEYEPADVGDLDWDAGADPAMVGRLNDLAYGLPADAPMAPAMASAPADESLRFYQARLGGEPVSALGVIDHASALAEVVFVATHPEFQGQGLATRLMHVALAEAKERGLTISALQSSAKGFPIYDALGYSDDFGLTFRERRT